MQFDRWAQLTYQMNNPIDGTDVRLYYDISLYYQMNNPIDGTDVRNKDLRSKATKLAIQSAVTQHLSVARYDHISNISGTCVCVVACSVHIQQTIVYRLQLRSVP